MMTELLFIIWVFVKISVMSAALYVAGYFALELIRKVLQALVDALYDRFGDEGFSIRFIIHK